MVLTPAYELRQLPGQLKQYFSIVAEDTLKADGLALT